MQYLGIDWGTRRAAWCALSQGGELAEGTIPAEEDGRARLVSALGPDVRGCIEMMSGAVWVRDRLAAAGWTIEIADARKVKAIAPLACKTDRVDARVLADLVRRDLVPTVWVPPLDERAIRERLRRRSHLIRLRTSAINRTFGLLTQWGLRRNLTALRKPDAIDELSEHGVPAVWRQSIVTLLGVIDDLDGQLAPLEGELRPLARADERAQLPMTIPCDAELLGLTLASESGDISRFPSARKLVGYSGLTPTIKQFRAELTHRPAVQGRTQHAALGRRGGRPTGLAALQPLAPPLHRHQAAPRQEQSCQGRRRAQGPHRRLARALPPSALQAQRLERHRSCPGKLLHSSGRLTAHKRSEKPGQLQPDHVRPRAPKEISAFPLHRREDPRHETPGRLTSQLDTPAVFKEMSGWSGGPT